ncbi:MAG: hypothetical protein N2482_02625 [Patescibacteria group bacterium]|nr:hypothetical protein [Patescibacteria group bacterium]
MPSLARIFDDGRKLIWPASVFIGLKLILAKMPCSPINPGLGTPPTTLIQPSLFEKSF